jgi:hypothetical protein
MNKKGKPAGLDYLEAAISLKWSGAEQGIFQQ